MHSQQPDHMELEARLTVTVSAGSLPDAHFNVKASSRTGKVLEAFLERTELLKEEWKFTYHGRTLDPSLTLYENGIRSNATLSAQRVQWGHGTLVMFVSPGTGSKPFGQVGRDPRYDGGQIHVL